MRVYDNQKGPSNIILHAIKGEYISCGGNEQEKLEQERMKMGAMLDLTGNESSQ